MNRPALLLAAAAVLCFLLSACSNVPQDMTVSGTVKLTALNGAPPAQAYGSCCGIDTQVNITADDAPGNYQGQPWNEAVTGMTLTSSAPGVMTYAFTAQVPDDAGTYQISLPCCTQALEGQDFTLQQMQAGPAVCIGDGCPP